MSNTVVAANDQSPEVTPRQIVERVYAQRQHEIEISAESLAADAMAEVDPDNVSGSLIRFAADLTFRKIAKSVLQGPVPEDDEAHANALQEYWDKKRNPGAA